jgi:rhamnogalacturonyl hydrolase YesR
VVARAFALALAAWLASGAPTPAAEFVATWTLLYLVPMAFLAGLEQPLLRGLSSSEPRRGRAALVGAGFGLGWGLLIFALASPFRSLGALGPLALAAGAGVAAGLVPLRGLAGGVGAQRLRARRWALAGAGLLGLVAALALAIDPEGQYRERYVDNRLTAEDLAAPSPLKAGQAPEELSDLELAGALARTWIRTHPVEDLPWSWEEAVALEGLLAYGQASGDLEPERFARAWAEAHREEALTCTLWADAAAPAATALRLHGPSHPAVVRVRAYLREDAPRTGAGAVSHTGLMAGGALPPSAWVDSLFMHGVLLNRLHGEHGDAWAREEAERLVGAALRELRDPEAGLFRHAHVDLGLLELRLPVEATYWARGNGWAAWALVDTLLARRQARAATSQGTGATGDATQAARNASSVSIEPGFDVDATEALEGLFAALRRTQDSTTGLWRTDLEGLPAGNPLETSASALFVAAWTRARAAGLVADAAGDRERLVRARAGLRGQIHWRQGHPVLVGTTTGTDPAHRAAYRAVSADENVGHGIGAVLLALSQPLR